MKSSPSNASKSRPRLPRGIALLLLLAAAGLVLWSTALAERRRREWAAAVAERAALSRQVHLSRRAATATVSRGAPVDGAVGSSPKVTVTDWDLALQSARLRLQAAQDEELYRAFFQRSQLSPEQIEQFLATRHLYHAETISTDAARKSEGVSDQDAAAVALKLAAEDRLKSAERLLLGEAGFQELQEYERTSWIRQQITAPVAGLLAFTDEPLRAAQADQLLRAVDAASAEPNKANGGGHVDWTAVELQSRQFLTPKQQARLASLVSSYRREELIDKVRPLVAEPPPDLPR